MSDTRPARLIYMNDRLVPEREATVSVFDHGLLYGDGIFEGIRVYSGKVFRMQDHVDRLFEGAKAIRLEIPKTHQEVVDAINDTVAKNNITDGYVRLVITRGSGSLGLDIRRTENPQVIIIADSISLYPAEHYEQGLEIITASTLRNHPSALSPRIKSLNYLNNILAKIEATDADKLEALMLNHKGEVAECTGDNIFIVRDGILKTPPTDAGILEGITRNVVIELAREAGIDVRESTMLRHDVYSADECFLTGSAAEVIPVVKLDNRTIGDGTPGPMTKQLLAAFQKAVRE